MKKAVQHLHDVGTNDDWETRKSDLDDAMRRYKVSPEIDVFASDENKKFDTYFTKNDSAFDHKITKDAFANPPYSIIGEAMKFLYYNHLSFNNTIMVLAYSKTDTKWWHSYVEERAEVHFIKGRLKFELDGIIPRYCSECKKQFVAEIDYCPNLIENEDGNYVRCQSLLKKNSSPYPSCWIIYRRKKI